MTELTLQLLKLINEERLLILSPSLENPKAKEIARINGNITFIITTLSINTGVLLIINHSLDSSSLKHPPLLLL